MNNDVFICHSSKDADWALKICSSLENEAGVRCWIAPRNITGGKLYAEEIVDAIENTQVFVFVFSRNSNVSNHVVSEVNHAFNANKPIIPFCIDDSTMRSLFEYYTNTIQRISAYPDPLEKIKDLKEAVLKNIPVLQKELERKGAYTILSKDLGISEKELQDLVDQVKSDGGIIRKRTYSYDFALCYHPEDKEAIAPFVLKMKQAGFKVNDNGFLDNSADSIFKVICDGIYVAAAFICLYSGKENDLMICEVTAATAYKKPMYLGLIESSAKGEIAEAFDHHMTFDLSDDESFLTRIKREKKGVVEGKKHSESKTKTKRFKSDRYDMLQNAAGEILIIIERQDSSPENPRLVYDGGEQALVYRSRESAFVLNSIAEEARDPLLHVSEVLMVEMDGEDFAREYKVPVRIVRSLAALAQI